MHYIMQKIYPKKKRRALKWIMSDIGIITYGKNIYKGKKTEDKWKTLYINRRIKCI